MPIRIPLKLVSTVGRGYVVEHETSEGEVSEEPVTYNSLKVNIPSPVTTTGKKMKETDGSGSMHKCRKGGSDSDALAQRK